MMLAVFSITSVGMTNATTRVNFKLEICKLEITIIETKLDGCLVSSWICCKRWMLMLLEYVIVAYLIFSIYNFSAWSPAFSSHCTLFHYQLLLLEKSIGAAAGVLSHGFSFSVLLLPVFYQSLLVSCVLFIIIDNTGSTSDSVDTQTSFRAIFSHIFL